jgi:hypothetical protein
MNRLLTTLVQIAIAIPAIFMARIVLLEIIEDWKEAKQ